MSMKFSAILLTTFVCVSGAFGAPPSDSGLARIAGLATITMEWDGQDFSGFEGALAIPGAEGRYEILSSEKPGTFANGAVRVDSGKEGCRKTWTILKPIPGLLGFYVTERGSQQQFSEPRSFAEDGLAVRISTSRGGADFLPPPNEGLVWHAFDLIGEDATWIPDGAVFPMKTMVYGIARDAVTGDPLQGIAIRMKDIFGGPELAATSDARGRYLIEADFGTWTLSASGAGLIAWQDKVAFINSDYPVRRDIHLTSPLRLSQYRFVLSWGASPEDLDLHVAGPTPDGAEFHISYRAMRSYARRHFLDRDDTTAYGPETITLERLDPGMYSVAVHNYSDRSAPGSRTLSYSGAVIRAYREQELIGTAMVPTGTQGTVWHAFSLDGRTGGLLETGYLSSEGDPARVR